MEALNKNKEEIEKILKDCGNIEMCLVCQEGLKQRIKTSILLVEDEIEFLENQISEMKLFHMDFNSKFWDIGIQAYFIDDSVLEFLDKKEHKQEYAIKNNLQQLQSHLTWLKEQEKKL